MVDVAFLILTVRLLMITRCEGWSYFIISFKFYSVYGQDDDMDSPGSQISKSLPYSPSMESNKSGHSDYDTMSSYSYSRDETVSIERPIDTNEGPEINEVLTPAFYYTIHKNHPPISIRDLRLMTYYFRCLP